MRQLAKQNKIAVFLLAFGALLLVLGLCQGEYRDTLNKAIRVCLECIGIGGRGHKNETTADTAQCCIVI